MTKYLKHYWKRDGEWLTSSNGPNQHHPEADYPGLGVKVWMHDSDGIDVCLSEVPDDTTIETIIVDSKNAVMELTESQYNSVHNPYMDSSVLFAEAENLEVDGDFDAPPPPADVIVLKTEFEPFTPAALAVGGAVPPAPTVIG